MCGLIGLVAGTPVAPGLLDPLLDDLEHRGSDGRRVVREGGIALGATRLAIQGDARGRQPTRSRDARFDVAFNGEVLEPEAERLRGRLAARRHEAPDPEAGDTPLLAEAVALLAGGPAGLHAEGLATLLEGSMGAMAVHDRARREVWLVRDRLGVKPLYAAPATDGLWFASEIRPLLRAVPAARAADPRGLAELLRWHRPGRRLPFRGVEALAPGAVWRVSSDGRVERWVRREGPPAGDGPGDDDGRSAVASLGRALEASARAAARAPGAPVLLLSGGLDSGAVAVLAGRRDVVALTGRFEPHGGDLDESPAAARVAAVAGLGHRVVDLRDEDLLGDLPDVVRALEVPLAGPGALPLWAMARAAREEGRVVLTGTGGDELLGGYARTALLLGREGRWTRGYEPLAARIASAGSDPARRRLAAADRTEDLRPLLDPDFAASLPPPEPPPVPAAGGAPTARDLVADEVAGTLPMLLHVEDRVTMAHGLEGRPVPCLGAVAAAAARLPSEWLVGPDGEGKRALREVLRGRLPEEVRTDPRKRGFPTPFARAARGPGRERAEALLADRRFRERGWWNVAACRRALEEERPLYDRALYVLLCWEHWARAFLDGDALAPEDAA